MTDDLRYYGYCLPPTTSTPPPLILEDPMSPLLVEARRTVGRWTIRDESTGRVSIPSGAPRHHDKQFERTPWNGGVVVQPTQPRPRSGRTLFHRLLSRIRRHKDDGYSA
jgi:hypothetical protein